MAPLRGAVNVATKTLAAGKGHATVPDNCQLIELTDQTVLTNIRRRYEQDEIYTFTGNILLAVNPYHVRPNRRSPARRARAPRTVAAMPRHTHACV